MKKWQIVFLQIFLVTASINAQSFFLVKPYLQVGYEGKPTELSLLWHTKDTINEWRVEVKTTNNWESTKANTFNLVNVKNETPFVVYHFTVKGLLAGKDFAYRVLNNNKLVFEANGHAPKSNNQDYKFVAIGDIGALTKDQKKLASIMYKLDPDFVAVPGDIVYNSGLINDYTEKFWPIYNADQADSVGAPLMRRIPFIASVGNHDAEDRDMDKTPSALSYYYFWEQPLNGLTLKEGSSMVPLLKGSQENKNAFYTAAGKAYPSMSNFSYNYANAHWTVIDADNYVDWTDTALLNWVKNDLLNSYDVKWHFVLFHHPGFNSSREHFEQQQMRLLAPLFEAGKVDVVFNGHVHNYQRSFPLKFTPDRKGTQMVGGKDNKTLRGRVVNGKWILDKKYDGVNMTQANGVIYLVTGAGGQDLYNPEQENDPDSWQKFTHKFFSTDHSLTYIESKGETLHFKQIASSGKIVDEFMLTKKQY
jgi:predicted phosphodiesterase